MLLQLKYVGVMLGDNAVATEVCWCYAVYCKAVTVGVWVHRCLYCCKVSTSSCKSIAGQGVMLGRKSQASRIAAEYVRIRDINRKFASLVALGHRNLRGKIVDMQDFRLFLAFRRRQ